MSFNIKEAQKKAQGKIAHMEYVQLKKTVRDFIEVICLPERDLEKESELLSKLIAQSKK